MIADAIRAGPMIALGYSGGSDGVFKNLCELYKGDERFYWLGRSDVAPKHCKAMLDAHRHFVYHQILDADTVLVDLAGHLCSWPPLIFRRPIKYVDEVASGLAALPIDGVIESTAPDTSKVRMPPEIASVSFVNNIKQTINRYLSLETSRLEQYYDDANWLAIVQLYKANPRDNLDSGERDLYFAGHMNAGLHALKEALGCFTGPAFNAAVAATEMYRVATVLKPKSAGAWHNFGLGQLEVAIRLKPQQRPTQFRSALRAFAQCIKITNRHAKAFAGIGKCYLGLARVARTGQQKQELYAEAISQFRAALRVDTNLHAARNNMATAIREAGAATKDPRKKRVGDRKAEAEYRILAARGYPLGLYNLACCEAVRGNHDKCRAYLEECIAKRGMPHITEVATDKDMASVRRLGWFKDLMLAHYGAEAKKMSTLKGNNWA